MIKPHLVVKSPTLNRFKHRYNDTQNTKNLIITEESDFDLESLDHKRDVVLPQILSVEKFNLNSKPT